MSASVDGAAPKAMVGAVGLWFAAKLAFVILLGAVSAGPIVFTLSQFDAYW